MKKWDEKKDVLIDLIQVQNLPYEQIGKMFNCSGNNIKKVAKRLGIELKPKRKINENETFNKGKHQKSICLNCGKEYDKGKNTKGKYCSNKCQFEYQYKQNIEKWKKGELPGCDRWGEVSPFVKKYLLDKVGCKCEICGFNTPNKYTGLSILQIHHIDGNCMNNKEENLQVLCPNHHALTENFGRRNPQSGRKNRYK